MAAGVLKALFRSILNIKKKKNSIADEANPLASRRMSTEEQALTLVITDIASKSHPRIIATLGIPSQNTLLEALRVEVALLKCSFGFIHAHSCPGRTLVIKPADDLLNRVTHLAMSGNRKKWKQTSASGVPSSHRWAWREIQRSQRARHRQGTRWLPDLKHNGAKPIAAWHLNDWQWA